MTYSGDRSLAFLCRHSLKLVFGYPLLALFPP